MGMLCGNAIAGVSVALSYVLKELECVSGFLPRARRQS